MFIPESKAFYHYLFPENICHISGLLNVDVSDFIRDHTTIPFFKAFVSREQYEESQKLIYQGKKYWQFLCRGIADKGWNPEISYCPVCLREARDFSGIRRHHQIGGVYVCHEHGCRLERFS